MSAKKSLIVGMFTLLIACVAMADPPADHPATGEPLVLECLRGTPDAIDGDLSDWNLAAMTPAVLDAAEQVYTGTWGGAQDLSGKFYVLWDDVNVYFAVVVKDDTLSMNKSGVDIWNADCAEVFFSTLNAVAGHEEHSQWGFNANAQKWNWEDMDGAGAVEPDYLQAAAVTTADGYICEVSMAYAGLSSFDFTAGSTIGFHVGLDDTDTADREIQMTWTGREAHDQSLGFGYLVLSNERAVAKEISKDPSPAVGAVDVPLDAILSWSPGAYAATHDVYIGTSFDDVNSATTPDSPGQTATTYDPGTLEYGQTYYWRVDEVNGTPDKTVYRGAIWSFAAEPFGYPIENVVATASSAHSDEMGPANTVNASGLDAADRHSVAGTDMWLSGGASLPAWIQYEFDRPYKLHQMLVWNSNQAIEAFVGFGAKDVVIEYSADGAAWTVLEGATEFAQATGAAGYAANTTVDFGGVMAQFVKITINDNWGLLPQTGLSEVRFLQIPIFAREPQPANGATDVGLDVTLNWKAGREAASHEVYFSTNEQAVIDGTALVDTVSDNSLTPAGLEYGQTYYWKVNEVNDAATPAVVEGDLWSFTAIGYFVVDDMESYDDDLDGGTAIFQTWIDGWDNGTGATVGYIQSPFAEQGIVNSGTQSMPLDFNNINSPFYSETERTWDSPQNWTGDGVTHVTVNFRGNAPGFIETGAGSFTMGAAGADIWDVADEFRYAYKRLNGDGSITAKVESIVETDVWAKAGVMIRESLDAGSKHAMTAVTPASSISFQRRLLTSDVSTNTDAPGGLAAPYWVKITRTGNTFKAQLSEDGVTWKSMTADAAASSVTIDMIGSVYIGLAVTSHSAGVSTLAEFSNVSTTGNVTGQWQAVAIGVAQPANDAGQLYVALEDSAGKLKVVNHPDANATVATTWQEWNIPLSDFTGVNMAKVTRMIIGVGDRDNPTPDGSGLLYIDDIRVSNPAPAE